MIKMRVKYLSILVLAIVILSVSVMASMLIPANDKARENAKAPENSPVIGENWDLERVDFIHYVKPESPGKPIKTETCYKLLGVKWNILPVNYAINPLNPQNLSNDFVSGAISTSAETWDMVTSSELFNDIYTVDYSAQYGIQNFQNAIAFGDYPDNNVIAVTSVWYTRIGKKIVEFDMLFNTKFVWGDATNSSGVMDLQNIATHELGHSVGLADIYSTTCSAVTMYGYSNYNEIQKRTLEQPDVSGLQKMYSI